MQHCWRNARKKRKKRKKKWQNKHIAREEKTKDEMRKNGNKKLYRLDQMYDSTSMKNFPPFPPPTAAAEYHRIKYYIG